MICNFELRVQAEIFFGKADVMTDSQVSPIIQTLKQAVRTVQVMFHTIIFIVYCLPLLLRVNLDRCIIPLYARLRFMLSKSFQVCLTLLCCHSAFSQVVGNIRSRVEMEKIIIEYDLYEVPANAWVDVKAYSSHNSFSAPLANLSGAAGKISSSGANKKMEWNYGNVLDNFNGNLSFEVEAEVIFKLAFLKPKKFIRRGKDNVFSWSGGRPEEYVRMKLISPTTDVVWEVDVQNKTGTQKVKPRPKLGLSKDYQLELASNDDKVTIPIQLKRKVSRFWIVSPIVIAAGAGAYFLFFAEEPLPQAPGPPPSN